jgi:hypothetical protein
MDAHRAKRAVEAALASYSRPANVEVGAPPPGSSDRAIYIWLTAEERNGPHVLVMDGGTAGGFLVVPYFEDGEQVDDPATAESYQGAGRAVAHFVSELSGITG